MRRCVLSFSKSHGEYPYRPVSDWELMRKQWLWNAGLSIAFKDEVKEDSNKLHTRLSRYGIQAIDIQNAITLETINLEQVQAAYAALVEFSFQYKL